jgi:hypothetical protein
MYMVAQADRPCLEKLAIIWGAYGVAMAALWHVAQRNQAAEVLVWGIGVLSALWLLLRMREV